MRAHMQEEEKSVVNSMNDDATKIRDQAAAEEVSKKTENNTPAAGNVEQKQVEQDNQTQD